MKDDPKEPSTAEVLSVLANILKGNQDVQKLQLKQTEKRSLTQGPTISVFNPRGQKDFPMPELKCEIHAPWQSKPGLHAFTREEVELINLLEPGRYPVDMVDGSSITVNVVGLKNGQSGRIESMTLCGEYDETTRIYAALYTKENKQLFPGFAAMLRQMLGDKAKDVMTMREETRRVGLPEDHADHLAVSVGA